MEIVFILIKAEETNYNVIGEQRGVLRELTDCCLALYKWLASLNDGKEPNGFMKFRQPRNKFSHSVNITPCGTREASGLKGLAYPQAPAPLSFMMCSAFYFYYQYYYYYPN